MKNELLGKPPRRLNSFNADLLLTCLAFLLGVAAYIFIRPSFPSMGNGAYSIVNLDYRVFGCVFLLIMLQLTAFSVIGIAVLPFLNFAFGLFLPMSLSTIMPAGELGVKFILKAFPIVLVFVFLALYFSCSANSSSKKFYGRVRSDKHFRIELFKTLSLVILFVILSVIGISDLNTII